MDATPIGSPSDVIVGTNDLDASASLYHALGFTAAEDRRIGSDVAAGLFGLDAPTIQRRLAVPGRDTGTITLVATPHPGAVAGPYDRGGYDISLYTNDLARAAQGASDAGARVGPAAVLDLGPIVLHQQRALTPDGVRIVFIQSANRRASVLDDEPDRLCSEVHSVVWCVSDVAAAGNAWVDAGMVRTFDMPIAHPAVSRFLELPRTDVPIHMALLSDAAVSPIRFELLAFPDDAGGTRPAGPLIPGIDALAFEVHDLDAAVAALPSAAFGARVTDDGRPAIRGATPDGVTFVLRG